MLVCQTPNGLFGGTATEIKLIALSRRNDVPGIAKPARPY
jgi:hypothetical protein